MTFKIIHPFKSYHSFIHPFIHSSIHSSAGDPREHRSRGHRRRQPATHTRFDLDDHPPLPDTEHHHRTRESVTMVTEIIQSALNVHFKNTMNVH